VIAEEHLIERAQHLGTKLTARLKSMQAKYSAIGEVRGLGAMVAIELVKNGSAEQPDADLTRALVQAAARHDLIILSCGVYGNVIRFLAPLTISDALLGEGLDRLDAALAEVSVAPIAATA
jgi:4-aminobutyrate aminotransferase/(S)-3-amino-2-methylpropionate transaminase